MKFTTIVLSLFIAVAISLNQVEAQEDDSSTQFKPRKIAKFEKLQENDGKTRIYDPCNYNPFDHGGCSSSCWSIGYYYGGFCSGYDCFCYT